MYLKSILKIYKEINIFFLYMNLGPSLNNLQSYCISIGKRVDRRTKMSSQMKRKKISPPKYLISKKDDDPILGCQKAHLNAINTAVSNNFEKILILEDDAKFLRKPNIKDLPPDWDILYLGGNITKKYKEEHGSWIRVNSLLTHAYVVNLKNLKLISEINKIKNNKFNVKSIDEYYNLFINPNFKCYMHNPMIMTQDSGKSDITGQENCYYGDIENTFYKYQSPESYILDNNFMLIMPEIAKKKLPYVTLITPTKNRNWAFSIAYDNFCNLAYPQHKLEWIIIDDSTDDDISFENYIPKNNRIKYIKLDTPHSIFEKRKIGVENASYDYLAFIDDDDYYPPNSIIARVKLLIKYDNISCIGSSKVGVYDIVNKKSANKLYPLYELCESSLLFTKEFWQNTNFKNFDVNKSFTKQFLENRYDEIMDIPDFFNVTCLSHGLNDNDDLKEVENSSTNNQFLYDSMSDSMKAIIDQFNKFFLSRKNKPKAIDIDNNTESNSESNVSAL